MSLYVVIEKEDEVKVIYHYGPNQESLKKLEISKENPKDMYPKKLIYAS
jgi:hypothetical protein